mgnify:CR=1 FL=1
MRTKSKEMILNSQLRRPDSSTSLPLPISQPPQESPVHQLKRSPSHISHVNEYNFLSVVNRRDEPDTHKEALRQLEAQNFRLIEDYMQLADWTHGLLNKLKESVRRAILAIGSLGSI